MKKSRFLYNVSRMLLLALTVFLITLSTVYAAEDTEDSSKAQDEETVIITIDGSITGGEPGGVKLFSIDTQPPTAPGNLRTGLVTDTTITIEWSPCLDNQGVAEYLVYDNYELLGTTDSTSYLLSDVDDEDTFLLTVRAKDYAGNISDSSDVLCIYHVLGEPVVRVITAPYNLNVSRVWDNKLTLVWSSDETDPDIAYEIYNGGLLTGTTENTYYVVSGLTYDEIYSFEVRAKDLDSRYSDFSNTISYTYQGDYTPSAPEPPANLRTDSVQGNSVTLKWDAPEDTSNLQNYILYDEDRTVGTTSANSYTVTGLVNEDTYLFTVRAKAYDGTLSDAGNSLLLYHIDGTASNPLNVTAQASVNHNLVTVTGRALANNTVTVTVRNIQNITVYTASSVCGVTDGGYTFSFIMPTGALSGVYTVTVEGEGVANPAVTTFNYVIPEISNVTAQVGSGNLLYISGTTTLTNGETVSLNIIKQGETTPLLNEELVTNTSADGSFSFEPLSLPEEGTYMAVVTCEGVAAPVTKIFTYEMSGDVSYEISVNNNVVTVSGNTSAGAGKAVTILVRDANQNIVYVDQSESGIAGGFAFIFAMQEAAAFGKYTVLVGGESVQNPVSKTFTYTAGQSPGSLFEVSVNEDIITVSGTATAGKAVTILVRGADESIVYVDQTDGDAAGGFEFKFAMPQTAESGEYEVRVGGEGRTPSVQSFTYIKTVRESLFDAHVNIQGYVMTISGTVSCGENKKVTLLLKDTGQNTVYLDEEITDTDGEYSFSCTLPSLLSSAQYLAELKSYDISESGVETVSASVSVNINISNFTATVTGTAVCKANKKVIVSAVDMGFNLINETKELEEGTYTFSDSISTLLLITGSADISVACLGRIIPEVPEKPVTVTASAEVHRSVVTVGGNISSGEGRNVTILVRDKLQNIAYVDQIVSGTAGAYEFKFMLPESGDYSVLVGGEDVQPPTALTLYYEKLTEDILVKVSITGKTVSVEGSTVYEGGKALLLSIVKEGEETPLFAVPKTVVTDSDGRFVFAPVTVPLSTGSGKYTAVVTAEETQASAAFWMAFGNTVVGEARAEGNIVTVSGATGVGAGKAVTVLVRDSGGNIVYVDQENSGEDSGFSFVFALPEGAPNGEYAVLIGGENILPPLAISFTYGPTIPVPVTVSVSVGISAVTVTGTTTAGSGKTVTLDITKQGETASIFAQPKTAQTMANGSFSFTVPISEIPADGEYTARVMMEGDSAVKNFVYPDSTPEALKAPVLLPLKDSDITDTTVNLSWHQAKGGMGEITYSIYINEELYIENIGGTSYTVQNLTLQNTYSFMVVATDTAGNSRNSNLLIINTRESVFNTIQISVALDLNTGNVTIVGQTNLQQGKKVLIRIFDPDNYINNIGQTVIDTDGNFTYAYKINGNKNGTYQVIASIENLITLCRTTFDYNNASIVNTIYIKQPSNVPNIISSVYVDQESLASNQLKAAVTITNQSTTEVSDYMTVLALYDNNNTLINYSNISSNFQPLEEQTLNIRMEVLPNNAESAKIFICEGADTYHSSMIPVSDVTVVQLSEVGLDSFDSVNLNSVQTNIPQSILNVWEAVESNSIIQTGNEPNYVDETQLTTMSAEGIEINTELRNNGKYCEKILLPDVDLNVIVTLKNNKTVNQQFVPIISLYRNGNLYSTNIKSSAVLPGHDGKTTMGLRVPSNDLEEYTVKVFVWQDVAGLVPLTSTIQLTNIYNDYFGNDSSAALEIEDISEASGAINSLIDEDWFKFTPSEGYTYILQIADNINTIGSLYVEGNLQNSLYTNDSLNDSFDITTYLMEGQTYYLKVSGNTVGEYSLKIVKGTDRHGNDFNSATPISIGNVNAEIDFSEDIDVFIFEALKGGLYIFETYGGIDVYGSLFMQTDLSKIVSEDNNGLNNNFRISATLEEGEKYYIYVRGRQMGRYVLNAQYAIGNIFGTISPVKCHDDDSEFSRAIEGRVTLSTYDTHEFVAAIHLREWSSGTSSSAAFNMTGVHAGKYLVSITRPGYLTRYRTIDLEDDIKDLGSVELFAGDVNGDGIINAEDSSLLQARLGSQYGGSRYDIAADLNGDKIINSVDLALLTPNLGKNANVYGEVSVNILTVSATVSGSTLNISGTAAANSTVALDIFCGSTHIDVINVTANANGVYQATYSLSAGGHYIVRVSTENQISAAMAETYF